MNDYRQNEWQCTAAQHLFPGTLTQHVSYRSVLKDYCAAAGRHHHTVTQVPANGTCKHKALKITPLAYHVSHAVPKRRYIQQAGQGRAVVRGERRGFSRQGCCRLGALRSMVAAARPLALHHGVGVSGASSDATHVCVMRVMSCSMIGPASSSLVA